MYQDAAYNRRQHNWSMGQYHEYPAISSGGIRTFAKDGPLLFCARYVERTVEAADTEPKRLGTAFHLAMSQPDDWESGYALIPTELAADAHLEAIRSEFKGRTKATLEPGEKLNLKIPAHRAYIAAHEQAALDAGKEILLESQVEPIRRMVASVYDNPACTEYVGHGYPCEVACTATCKKTGLPLKALADLLVGGVIVDFKTTRHTTANAFIREALYKLSYQYQADWYLRVFGAERFVIISVRNEPPYEALCFNVPKNILSAVREANDFHLHALRDCYDTDSWNSLGWGAELSLDDGERLPQ